MIAREIASRVSREEVGGYRFFAFLDYRYYMTTSPLSTACPLRCAVKSENAYRHTARKLPSLLLRVFPSPSFLAVDPLLHVAQIPREALAGVLKNRQAQSELDLGHLLYEIYKAEAL